MANIQPAYIVPLLVEQPTWGGFYIPTQKEIDSPLINGKKIGQSFELFSGTWLTSVSPTTFAYAPATQLAQPTFADPNQSKETLQSWIDQDRLAVLGSTAVNRDWKTMQVLIKFTQALNNSYQVHVKPGQEFGKWLPKPESWYFVESGQATLGLVDPDRAGEYKARCFAIDNKAQQLSHQIKMGELTVADARVELRSFIELEHPNTFVNTVAVPKDAIIDLSQGGTHHSWEVGPDNPNGNIVYEVQVDVQDEFCTLRSYDQGNIKDDGSVRPLAIDDYFNALDLSPEANDPSRFSQTAKTIVDGTAKVTTLFANQYYVTELVEIIGQYAGRYTQTSASFHHLYSLSDSFTVQVGEQDWFVPAGWPFFIPASVGSYQIKTADQHCKVLITHL